MARRESERVVGLDAKRMIGRFLGQSQEIVRELLRNAEISSNDVVSPQAAKYRQPLLRRSDGLCKLLSASIDCFDFGSADTARRHQSAAKNDQEGKLTSIRLLRCRNFFQLLQATSSPGVQLLYARKWMQHSLQPCMS